MTGERPKTGGALGGSAPDQALVRVQPGMRAYCPNCHGSFTVKAQSFDPELTICPECQNVYRIKNLRPASDDLSDVEESKLAGFMREAGLQSD